MIRLSQLSSPGERWSLRRALAVEGASADGPATSPFRRNFVVLAARNPDQPLSESARRRIGKGATRSPGAWRRRRWRQAMTEKRDVTPEKTRTLPIGRRELLSLEKVTTLLGRSPSSTRIYVWLTFGLNRDAT
jgi:hypothetical protein